MVRIYSKKAFAIGEGLKRGTDIIESFVTVPGAFMDMPEKYLNDATFLLAQKAGDITVVTNSSVEKQMEFDDNPTPENYVQSELEAFYEELKVMSRDDTFTLGEKYGVKPKNNEKLGQYKKRILEAYKLHSAGTEPDNVMSAEVD